MNTAWESSYSATAVFILVKVTVYKKFPLAGFRFHEMHPIGATLELTLDAPLQDTPLFLSFSASTFEVPHQLLWGRLLLCPFCSVQSFTALLVVLSLLALKRSHVSKPLKKRTVAWQ